MPDPKPDDVDFHEETDSPSYADDRNFYHPRRARRIVANIDKLPELLRKDKTPLVPFGRGGYHPLAAGPGDAA